MFRQVIILLSFIALSSGLVNSGTNDLLYSTNSLRNLGSIHPFGGSIPSPRLYHSVSCCASHYVVVFGGYSTDGSLLNDIHLYDTRSLQWSGPVLKKQCCGDRGQDFESLGAALGEVDITIPYTRPGFEGDLPLGRAEHGSCVVNDVLYIFGGVTLDFGFANDLYSFDVAALNWKKWSAHSSQLPSRRAGHAVVAPVASNVRAAFFVFGGRGSVAGQLTGLNDVWEYSTLNRRWTRLSPSGSDTGPAGRQHSAVAVVEDKLFVYGGVDPVSNLTFSDLWVFHCELGTWQQLLANEGTGAGLAPPALHSSFFIPTVTPYALDPSLANDVRGSVSAAALTLLLYGGVGGGGSCSGTFCNQKETTLGQVYRLEVHGGWWESPRLTVDEQGQTRTQHMYIENATWHYARLTSASSSRGRLWKNFAFEGLAYCPARRQLYELGGVQATAALGPPRDAAGVPEPRVVDSGGRFEPMLWDLTSGEDIKQSVELPMNPAWVYWDAFATAQPLAVSPTAQFLTNYRIYTVTDRDIILTHPQNQLL